MRAFLHDPPVVYLDEPTKGLDPIIAKRIRSHLKQLVRQEGKSLLLTSYMLTEVEELADRVALIHQGGIMIALLALVWRQVSGIAQVLGILFEMLAGAYLPLSAFPQIVQYAVYLLPGFGVIALS